MVLYILAVLALWVVLTLVPPIIRYAASGLSTKDILLVTLGPRDSVPEMPERGLRAERALNNLMEAMPVFLAVALLIETQGAPSPQATLGATIFVAARVLHSVFYIAGTAVVRSLVWTASWVGLAMMIATIV